MIVFFREQEVFSTLTCIDRPKAFPDKIYFACFKVVGDVEFSFKVKENRDENSKCAPGLCVLVRRYLHLST